MKGQIKMNLIYARYNMQHNSIDINKAEEGLKTTAWTDHVLNAMAIDNPLEYAQLALDGNLQMLVDAEDNLELW